MKSIILLTLISLSLSVCFDTAKTFCVEMTAQGGGLDVKLTAPSQKWAGFGFGTGMSNGNCYVAIPNGNSADLKRFVSPKKSNPTPSTSDATNVKASIAGGVMTVTFTLPAKSGTQGLIWAQGKDATFAMHASEGLSSINIAAATGSTSNKTTATNAETPAAGSFKGTADASQKKTVDYTAPASESSSKPKKKCKKKTSYGSKDNSTDAAAAPASATTESAQGPEETEAANLTGTGDANTNPGQQQQSSSGSLVASIIFVVTALMVL